MLLAFYLYTELIVYDGWHGTVVDWQPVQVVLSHCAQCFVDAGPTVTQTWR